MAPGINPLTSLIQLTRWPVLQKVRRRTRGASTLYKYVVSDTISFPSRGAFHLSLTVLVHYWSQNLFSLGRWSSLLQAGLHVSDPTLDLPSALSYFRLRGYHPVLPTFPELFD